MMKRVVIAGVIAVLLALVAAGMWAADREGPGEGKPVMWEHLALQHDASRGFADADLSGRIVSLGKQGWPLVTHTLIPTTLLRLFVRLVAFPGHQEQG